MKKWEITWFDGSIVRLGVVEAFDVLSALNYAAALGNNCGSWSIIKMEQINRN